MNRISFEKYQGNGNDFIIIDSRNNNKTFDKILSNKILNIKEICDRNFGIGGDGLIFIKEAEDNNYAKMIIYNSDGSEAEMCGNGIRCLVEYLHNNDDIDVLNNEYRIETKAGIKVANYDDRQISVMMGSPIFENQFIPTTIRSRRNSLCSHFFKELDFQNTGYAVGMGNPHLIFFLDNLNTIDLELLGPLFENNILFPEKTNVHFAKIIDKNNIKVLVWERGVGATLACGTGACAVHVAAFKLGLCNKQTNVNLPGGNLIISWSDDCEEVMMTGNANAVFSGEYCLN